MNEKQRRLGLKAMDFLEENAVVEHEREAVFAGFCCGYDRGETDEMEKSKVLLEALEFYSNYRNDNPDDEYNNEMAIMALKRYKGES
jgi:hypothetical protein